MNAPTFDPAGDSARKRDSSATVTVVTRIPRKERSCHNGVRTLTRGWLSRSLHRSSPQTGSSCALRQLESFIQAGDRVHVDRSHDDIVAMAFDAQLLQIGADDRKRGDLWNTGECCPKLAQQGRFILRVEIAVAEKPGQELRLVACRIEVQPRPFYDRVDNSLTAVANEFDGVLAAAFQGEDQRDSSYCDDDTEREGQRDADGDTRQMPR